MKEKKNVLLHRNLWEYIYTIETSVRNSNTLSHFLIYLLFAVQVRGTSSGIYIYFFCYLKIPEVRPLAEMSKRKQVKARQCAGVPLTSIISIFLQRTCDTMQVCRELQLYSMSIQIGHPAKLCKCNFTKWKHNIRYLFLKSKQDIINKFSILYIIAQPHQGH